MQIYRESPKKGVKMQDNAVEQSVGDVSPPDIEFGDEESQNYEFIKNVNEESLEVTSQREVQLEKLESNSDLDKSMHSQVPKLDLTDLSPNKKRTPMH